HGEFHRRKRREIRYSRARTLQVTCEIEACRLRHRANGAAPATSARVLASSGHTNVPGVRARARRYERGFDHIDSRGNAGAPSHRPSSPAQACAYGKGTTSRNARLQTHSASK